MPCRTVSLDDGATAIVCSRGARSKRCSVEGCRNPGTALCDHVIVQGKTCDRLICRAHSRRVGRRHDYDLCPQHAEAL